MLEIKMEATIRNMVKVPVVRGSKPASFVSFHNLCDAKEHVALLYSGNDPQKVPLVRLHSECLTGDIFGSKMCDCGAQLDESLTRIAQEGGVLLYLRQEGRGIGLYNKLDAYKLQKEGFDTFAANRLLGHPSDARNYAAAAQMLLALGYKKIRLLSNNPEKSKQLCIYSAQNN
ncbi:GTP cyclohydrolase II RibA [Nitrincola sp. MINF-07-Sa-05]|uniref:GTP cyclohydrolase II RibA n=1 Tax=Nitrincola salilacus TaxID=3400273 RepID=UPI003917F904